ncbi:DUF2726 domain-containing protein [Verrucomicrobiota bacterium]
MTCEGRGPRSGGVPDINSLRKGDRDSFVDKSFSSAGIPVVRIKCRNSYDLQEIRGKILDNVAEFAG